MTVDLERKMAQLEVKLLRAQFNSHFFFNNLNAINYHILQNNTRVASEYLTLFSRLMRRIMADSQRDFNKLSDEIETIRLYIQIESMRFNRAIEFQISVDPDINVGEIWIPSLILHTYLENSIWQTALPRSIESVLRLSVLSQEGTYHLVLEDNGFRNRNSDSISADDNPGFRMAEERLRLLNQCYGRNMQIAVGVSELMADAPGTRVNLSFEPFLF